MTDDQEDLRPYLHPLVLAQAAARGGLLAKRRAPVRRGPNGRWETGCSGNPFGRPKGRTTVRKALHKFGLEGVAKLAALADDPRLTPGERASVLSQCVQLSYAVRGIRSDAKAWRKAEQLRREREMDDALMDFVRRLGLPPRAKLMPSQAAQPSPEPREGPARPALPEAPGAEAKARSDGEAQAPADDGNSGPGQAPQRPFRISLPF
jgi:hypothetical protein